MDAVNGMVQAQEQAEALTKHAQVKIDSLLLALLDMPKAVWYLERPDVVVSVAPRSDSHGMTPQLYHVFGILSN